VLTKDLEVKGNKTTNDTRILKDFGRLGDNVITKDGSTDSNNDTRIPKDFASRGGALLKDDSQITTNDENSPMSPKCPDKGPIPPNCTIDPFLK